MTRETAVKFLLDNPYKLGHMVGLNKLDKLHNEWIKKMIRGNEDTTLQAHRGSYKTTCASIALAIICIILPNKRTLFIRKTDNDVKEVIRQVQNILCSKYVQVFVNSIYGVNIKLQRENQTEISTNLTTDIKGTSQLLGIGIGASLTGKHFDYIFTDDIVNIKDRVSKAERDRTKTIYQELHNIKNRDGKIFNTGTPWHKDDCFSIMPKAEKYDCYKTGIINECELKKIKSDMLPSLFSANYELKHIASEDVIFDEPIVDGDDCRVEQGFCHIDAAYGGSDYTAFTIMNYYDGKYYVLGKCWNKHVEYCLNDIILLRKKYNAGRIFCESNADKGYLARDLKKRGERVATYHEKMNKFIKITTYLKSVWHKVVFVSGTDNEYIEQICDFNENSPHDDCPDSLSSLIRIKWGTISKDRPNLLIM